MVELTDLVQWAPSVTVRDNTIQADLMKVRSLELQHLVDTGAIDLVCSLANLISCIVATAELSRDQPLAELIKEIKCSQMSATGDLDQFCKPIPYLTFRQGTKECEVEESVHRSVISPKTILVVAVVDRDFD